MTKKEVDKLSEILSEYGYKYNKSEMQFELKSGDYTYFIAFNCVDRKPQYKITFVFEIRNKKVEDIANKFTQSNPDYFKYSATVIIPFMYFVQKRLEFIVSAENDFAEIYSFFSSFYLQKIKPFSDEYSSLDKLSLFVDKVIQESNDFIPITINLYRRNIILLKLTNNNEFEERVNQLRTMIKSFPSSDLQNFEDTYEYLKTL